MVMQIRRTPTPDNPPGLLAEGQLAVEMASVPPKLWCGVPTSVNLTGRILLAGAAVETMRVVLRQITSSSTYTPSANMIAAIVDCKGGGGGGGWAYRGGQSLGGGGGGEGCLARKMVLRSDVIGGVSVAIGAGGATAAAGGATSFGALCRGDGGSGGGGFNGATEFGLGGSGGSTGVGDIWYPGLSGGHATVMQAIGGVWLVYGGQGGGSPYAPSTIGAGSAGGTYAAPNSGHGGNGAATLSDNAGVTINGGDGGSGYVLVTEFCFG